MTPASRYVDDGVVVLLRQVLVRLDALEAALTRQPRPARPVLSRADRLAAAQLLPLVDAKFPRQTFGTSQALRLAAVRALVPDGVNAAIWLGKLLGRIAKASVDINGRRLEDGDEGLSTSRTLMGALFRLMWFTAGSNQKNIERNAKIAALEEAVTTLRQNVFDITRATDDRVRSLEQRPAAMAYRGVFKDGELYLKGDVVTWGGSMWHALEQTSAKPDQAGSKSWQLCVKRGRDGRDGKDR